MMGLDVRLKIGLTFCWTTRTARGLRVVRASSCARCREVHSGEVTGEDLGEEEAEAAAIEDHLEVTEAALEEAIEGDLEATIGEDLKQTKEAGLEEMKGAELEAEAEIHLWMQIENENSMNLEA
jgi:hypothetical protein